ncbi:MAG: 50S ribosomal protein L6 [Bdellovibrionales bacterium]|nr:50S ribosomal protein L6 [Bdellovibrionales bacterium]
MSRVGKQAILLGKDVTVRLSEARQVIVQGKGKTMEVPFYPELELKTEGEQLLITRKKDDTKTRSLHGLSRALIQNAVKGVTEGWSKVLLLNGVGYKAAVSGSTLNLNLGYSHPIHYEIPKGIEVKVEKNTRIVISGINRELVGQTAQKIRSFRPPEPYLGKGVKYEEEVIRKKAGKSGGEKK